MAEHQVCELTADGIRAAKTYLAVLRQDADAKPPAGLLTDSRYAEPVAPAVSVEQRPFANRREAGAYLADRLAPLGVGRIADNAGLWSWLGMFYFEQVVGWYADGQMRIAPADVPYVIDPHSDRRGDSQRHRNRLLAAWDIYTRHGEARARGLLSHPVSAMEQLADRLLGAVEAYRAPGIMDLANRLYTDPATGMQKSGVAGGGQNQRPPGGIVRLLDVLNQLYMTYDVYGMTAEQLLPLLPAEFERWQAAAAAPGR